MRRLVLVCLVVLGGQLGAQTPGTLHVGMNLSAFSDYGAEYPTADLVKSSRDWFSHNDQWREGDQTNPALNDLLVSGFSAFDPLVCTW